MKESADWIEDLTIRVDEDEIIDTVSAFEKNLAYSGSRTAACVWVGLASLGGGAFAGVTLSRDIRGSTVAFIAYLVAAFFLFRLLAPVSRRLFGSAVSWLAGLGFFWTLVLGFSAVGAAHIDRAWLAYTVSGFMGALVGLVHGSLPPENSKHRDAWMLLSLPLGPLSTVAATMVYRNMYAASGSALATAIAGLLAAAIFALPLTLALRLWWSDAHALARIGMVLLHNENLAPSAVAYLDRAIALEPHDAELYNLRGIALAKINDFAGANANWEKVAQLKPGNPIPHMNRGNDFLRSGDLDQAVVSFELAVRMAPRHAMAHSNLGAALERRGELERAIEHYDRAIELEPKYANAYSNRAYAHVRRGDYEQALRDSERALQLNRRNAMAHVNRAHALRGLGDTAGAVAGFQDVLNLEPAPEIWEEAAAALESLRNEQPA